MAGLHSLTILLAFAEQSMEVFNKLDSRLHDACTAKSNKEYIYAEMVEECTSAVMSPFINKQTNSNI